MYYTTTTNHNKNPVHLLGGISGGQFAQRLLSFVKDIYQLVNLTDLSVLGNTTNYHIVTETVKVKVNQSHYRPRMTQKVPGN